MREWADAVPKVMVITTDNERITIDGVEFPYIILSEPIRVVADPDGVHVVYLPVIVQRVEIGTVEQ